MLTSNDGISHSDDLPAQVQYLTHLLVSPKTHNSIYHIASLPAKCSIEVCAQLKHSVETTGYKPLALFVCQKCYLSKGLAMIPNISTEVSVLHKSLWNNQLATQSIPYLSQPTNQPNNQLNHSRPSCSCSNPKTAPKSPCDVRPNPSRTQHQ